MNAFKSEQFAPSNNTSTHIHLPKTYPTEPPSNFEQWLTQDNEPEQPPKVSRLTMSEFLQMWDTQDGTAGSCNQMSEESSTKSKNKEDKCEDLAEVEERWSG